ncbi:MAG: type II toxin-antitoxin system VapC family toxin, partial [Candidatus Methanoperedens sp.]|nr:type II toxin-antitoxin system VapC family toxin [Candidatus Methanoperedens sp.]
MGSKDEHHTSATHLVKDIMKNKYGATFTSDMVFDESMTFILYKTGDINKAINVRDLVQGNVEKAIPKFMNLVFVDVDTFEKSWNTFVKYAGKKLSFTDCSTIELMKIRGIEYLASFDSGFDGIVS